MKQELQLTIDKLQGTSSPETRAGLGGVEIEGYGVVRIGQGQGITLGIQQGGNASGEGIGLAIAAAAVEQLQQRAAAELQGTVVQIRNRRIICIVKGKRISRTEGERCRRGSRAERRNNSQHTGDDGFTKQNRQVEFHSRRKSQNR